MAKYRIWYRDINGVEQVKDEETPETKARLLEHAHVIKVKELKEEKVKPEKKAKKVIK